MARLACILTAALWLSPLQETEERSVEEEIAALIEKTNALETFHLVYDVECTGEVTSLPGGATFELVYRAPDLARLRVTSEDGEMDVWVTDAQMVMRSDVDLVDLEDRAWHRADFPEPLRAALVLDELFPRQESPLEPGVFLSLTAGEDSETGKAALNLNFGHARHGRTFVLGWLDSMKRRSPEVTIEDQSLVLTGEHHRLRVSRSNGILEDIEAELEKGTAQLRLRRCRLDEPLEEDLIEMPAAAKSATLDPRMMRGFEGMFGFLAVRSEAFLRVEHQLQADRRSWNERTRDDWREFLDALHRDQMTREKSEWIEQLHEYVDQFMEWARSQRAEDDSPERLAALKESAANCRAKIEENFDGAESKYGGKLSLPDSTIEPRQELFDVEQEVISELWDELLRDPVLEAYDEKLAEVLE